MSYTDKKITQEEINAHHVQGATDYLIGNAQQNKAVFDDLPEFIAGKHNELIDELNSHHGDEIRVAVNEWLAEHPEVTTSVQDNSLTTVKYVDGSVTEPKIADGAVTPSKLDRAYSTTTDLASVNANLTNELNVLDARMDEFASLPEGSTSGNAELVDIRVGADGETYQTAGDAVRGQVGDLKYQVNTGAVLTNITPNWIDAYVNRYGVVAASSASQSALIKLKKGERITVGTRNTNIAIISTTDKDTLSISDILTPVYITSSADQFEEYTYTAETAINVVICVLKTNYSIAPYLYGDFRTTIQEYTDKIITYNLDEWFYGSYYSLDIPQFTHASNRNRTELFHVVEGEKIKVEPNGMRFVIGVWTFTNNVWHIEVNDNTWKTDSWEYDITHDSYWVFVFSKIDNGDIAEGENTAHVECTNINIGEDVFDLKNNAENIKTASAKASSIFNEKGHIIAHRGEPYPENTLVGFERCISNGSKIVEMDLAFTSDNVAVLLHDTTINRTGRNSDGSAIENTINISDITYAQALEYDFGIYKGSEYAGTKIPKLVDVLLYFKWHRCGAVIDLTGHSYTNEQLTILHEIMADCGMIEQCAINAFTAQLDNYTSMFNDSILNPTGSYVNITTIMDNIDRYKNKMAFMIASGVVASTVNTSKEYIAQITRLGVISALAFIDNVNDAKALFNNGCDFLYSNRLKDSDLE